ncbi:Condensin complex subunit 2 [Fragilaria crotonensis]|nr:Condensin complex subunit 2 [Fragilaria crotonensis]
MEAMASPTESPSGRKPFANLRLDDEDDDDDAGDAMPSLLTKVAGKKKKVCQRRRRRSSARFLKLSQPTDYADEDDEDDEEEAAPESEQLGELYKRAIRMNAENRINAGNSWNLKLIENMDKLTSNENGETVNFTKASCTLDASVKIYSYRVDDVHLTSYKVLANLNRNDAIEKKPSNNKIQPSNSSNLLNAGDDHDDNDQENDQDTGRTSGRKTTDTLETNLANINLSNLDSAYDIDPLFHKMSKTFDEGGAKGLLLVNLGVGPKGCNIVFDSKEEDDEEQKYNEAEYTEGMVDITSLTSKLDLLIGTEVMENIELVPQLRTLRQEYAILEKEGFITHEEKKSRRYATSTEEEKEAEMSIHQDFLERSRMSATTGRLSTADTASQPTQAMSQNTTVADDDDDDYAAVDYGDDDDDDGDLGFDQFISNDANGDRYSSISFQNDAYFDDTQTTKTTTALLNALCNDMTRNDYQFFSQETLDKLGNSWAGPLIGKNLSL